MGMAVVSGGMLQCTFGTAPASINATSQMTCLGCSKPIATIKDTAANVNIAPFGMCTSLANPQVASATAAALGVLTPQPCMLMAAGIWTSVKPTIMVGGAPCLTNDSQLICGNGMGTIMVTSPGQTKIII